MGLFLCKSLAKYLTWEGDIGLFVKSQLGEGSTFSVNLENKIGTMDSVVHNLARVFSIKSHSKCKKNNDDNVNN